MITLEDVFRAYFACRKKKRNTINALKFEVEYEKNCIQLYEELISGTYKIGRSIAFVVDKPVKREIFAADFRDRVVHHLIVARILPLLERLFIHDSYACRVGKGTFFGIQRLEHFFRSASENHRKEAYVLKLDISGFFMSINHDILLKKIENLLQKKYPFPDELPLVLSLCTQIIRNDPTKNCIFRSPKSKWRELPKEKTLFHSAHNSGLPIGNLTSQVFANLYLHELDVFVKEKLKIQRYGRYVDDMVFVHESKEVLLSVIPKIQVFLEQNLQLRLHPKKITLRRVEDGIDFLGAYLKPFRRYVLNRTKSAFLSLLARFPRKNGSFSPRISSYFGYLRQFRACRLRKKACELLWYKVL